jgi:hypothetical protein
MTEGDAFLPQIPGECPNYEMLWLKVNRGHEIIFIRTLYHPPKPIHQSNELLDYVEASVAHMQQHFTNSHIILAGNLN